MNNKHQVFYKRCEKSYTNEVKTLLKHYNFHLEKMIHLNPIHYLWAHPRWKKQKDGKDFYQKLKI